MFVSRRTLALAVVLPALAALAFVRPAGAVSSQQAMEAIANVRQAPYLGLPYDDFRVCFGRGGANLFGEMFDQSYPYYDDAQAAFENLALARMIETIPRGRLVDYMTAREREWDEYKRAYGYATFLHGASLGGVLDMLRDGYFSATKRYLDNYSLSGLYREYLDARSRGRSHDVAWRAVEDATFRSRSLAAGWHNAVGRMQDLARKFDIKLPGDEFLKQAFAFSYKQGDYSVDLDSVVENFIRRKAAEAAGAAIASLRDDPNLKRCLADLRAGHFRPPDKPQPPVWVEPPPADGVAYAEVIKSGAANTGAKAFVLEKIVFSKFQEPADRCGPTNTCKHYKRSASGDAIEDRYAISEGRAGYAFKVVKERTGAVLSDYGVDFTFTSPPKRIHSGDVLRFKTVGTVKGFTNGWFLNRSFTYYIKAGNSNNYHKEGMVNINNREPPANPVSRQTVITIPASSKQQVVIGGKLGWDPGLYIDWIYKEVDRGR
jgi:hypothetical protein